MTARELMTPDPACCTPDTPLQQVARMMVDCDCGEIPVVEREDLKKVAGVVTDRDIVCRAVAEGRNPQSLDASDVMTSPAVIVSEGDDIDDVIRLMEAHQIRRVPVVDRQGVIVGIVSQADVARRASRSDAAELVREVSAPAR
jgi:CBS domain-containing protein